MAKDNDRSVSDKVNLVRVFTDNYGEDGPVRIGAGARMIPDTLKESDFVIKGDNLFQIQKGRPVHQQSFTPKH